MGDKEETINLPKKKRKKRHEKEALWSSAFHGIRIYSFLFNKENNLPWLFPLRLLRSQKPGYCFWNASVCVSTLWEDARLDEETMHQESPPWKGHPPTWGPIRDSRQPQSQLNYRLQKVAAQRSRQARSERQAPGKIDYQSLLLALTPFVCLCISH